MAPMPNGESTLAAALNRLAALGTERDREQLLALLDRLDTARLRVLVVGEAKRGKSTLINALLGRDVLPSGVTPLTAVATTVRYSDDSRIEVTFLDGHEEKHPLTALADFVTEVRNPRNQRMVAGVTVYLDAPVLAGGAEMVDTPGTGSVFQWDTQAARETLPTMDAAVFVLTADPPVSASERDLLSQVADLSVTTFAVLNKADHLDEAELAETSEFTTQVLAEVGHRGTVYPMSARAALRGGDAGFTAFETDFTAYLSSRREADLRASAIAQARRVAGSLLDEVALTRRAAEMRVGEAADRVEQFSARLADVAVHSRDAVAVVIKDAERLLEKKEKDAARAAFRKALEGACDEDQVDATADQLQKLGEKVDLAGHFGFVRGWHLAAPFDNTNAAHFQEQHAPEKGVDLKAVYKGKNGADVRWHGFTTEDPHGVLDLNLLFQDWKEATAYAFAVIEFPEERRIQVRAGSINALKVFVNGKEVVVHEEYHHGMRVDQYTGTATVKAGRNELLVKICQNAKKQVWEKDWKLQVRLCDSAGAAVPFTQKPVKSELTPRVPPKTDKK